jgi:hypothetical protein
VTRSVSRTYSANQFGHPQTEHLKTTVSHTADAPKVPKGKRYVMTEANEERVFILVLDNCGNNKDAVIEFLHDTFEMDYVSAVRLINLSKEKSLYLPGEYSSEADASEDMQLLKEIGAEVTLKELH